MTILTKAGKALINDTELMARKALSDNFPAERTSAQIAVSAVFTAMWSSSMGADMVANISSAMGYTYLSADDIKAALTQMVKSKALRRNKGRYEINF